MKREHTSIIHLFIFTHEPVPVGMAATNRLFSYARGLSERGHQVKVCSSKPGFNDIHQQSNGVFENVEYSVLSKAKTWNTGVFLKLYFFFISHFRFFRLVKKNKNRKQTLIFLVTNKTLTFIMLRIFSWFYGIPLLLEKSEYPKLYRSQIPFVRNIVSEIYSSFIYKLFDGMVIMTETLLNYFRKYVKKSCHLLLYPLTLDTQRFLNAPPYSQAGFRYIGYLGSMDDEKDGIDLLLQTFSLVQRRVPDVKLLLAGNATQQSMQHYKRLSIELSIENDVIFTGNIDRDIVPSILNSAEVLVLTRPDSTQAQGGFPSKLGEYLASGSPVVVSDTGSISTVISHEKHALICKPGDIDDASEMIVRILNQPEHYKEMANQGRQLAFRLFDYKSRAEELEHFLLEKLICRKS